MIIELPDNVDHRSPSRVKVTESHEISVIDMTRTSFVTPFGCIYLCGMIATLREQGSVTVRMGSDNVATYLCRMDLHKPFAEHSEVVFEPDLKQMSISRLPQAHRLVELSFVDLANDDQVESAADNFWEIISNQAPVYRRLHDEIRTALIELLSNVETHSGVRCASVVAQTVKHCVRIAVGDRGIGIRKSLKRTMPDRVKVLSDSDVIELATQPDVTGSPFGRRGWGLPTIVNAIREHGRALHIASGRGVHSTYQNWKTGVTSTYAVRGTIVEVAFQRPASGG
jgi:anti-sigma regulatory factor (Ser/Thr protein kinase)